MLTGWFGAPGGLMPVSPYKGGLSETDARSVSEQISFSGARHVQVGPGSARSWSMSMAGPPVDLAPLRFAASRPALWVWVSPAAQASNLLTPAQSMLDPSEVLLLSGASTQRGALELGDGVWVSQWAGGTSTSTVSVTGAKPVPVRAGVPVTVSAWVQRSDPAVPVQMVFEFLDATGAVLFSTTRDSPAGSGLVRAAWTLTPPVGSASLTLRFRYAAVLAAPQVLWGSAPGPYSDGRGVYRVVVTDWSEDQELILSDGTLWLSASMTLMEVG